MKYIENNYKKSEENIIKYITGFDYEDFSDKDVKELIQEGIKVINKQSKEELFEAEFLEDFCRINLCILGKKNFGLFSSLKNTLNSFVFSDYLLLEILEDIAEKEAANKIDFLNINKEDVIQIVEEITSILGEENKIGNLIYAKIKFFSILKILRILGE